MQSLFNVYENCAFITFKIGLPNYPSLPNYLLVGFKI